MFGWLKNKKNKKDDNKKDDRKTNAKERSVDVITPLFSYSLTKEQAEKMAQLGPAYTIEQELENAKKVGANITMGDKISYIIPRKRK